MKKELIRNAEVVEFIEYEDGKGKVVIAVEGSLIVGLISDFINELNLQILPISLEQYSDEEVEKIIAACEVLGVNPHQEYIIANIEHYLEEVDSELVHMLFLDYNICFNLRTLEIYGLNESYMTDHEAEYTLPTIDDYETIVEILEENKDLNGLKCGGDMEVIDFMDFIYSVDDIVFRDIYSKLDESGDEEDIIIELEISEELYKKYSL